MDGERLAALGLLHVQAESQRGQRSLSALCAQGALLGGLSVAADIRPDELVGPLCQRLGGEAQQLRVLEALSAPAELWVQVAQVEERWAVPGVPELLSHLNRCYRDAPAVRAIALLGQWDGSWQLWCISKKVLGVLLKEGLLAAENSEELSALVDGSARLQEG